MCACMLIMTNVVSQQLATAKCLKGILIVIRNVEKNDLITVLLCNWGV